MSATRTSLSAGRPSSKKSKAATLSDLADKPATKRINFDVPTDIHTKLKVHAAQQGKTVKALMTEIVEELVK